MSRKFETILDDCLDQLQAGATVKECLARYPDHARDLRPLLTLASAVGAVPMPRPRPAVMHTHRQRMLDAVHEKAAHQQARKPFGLPLARLDRLSMSGLLARPAVRVALTVAVLILLVGVGTGGLVTAAADSLPGDSLYPVKRIAENVQLSLTFNPADRQRLRAEFAQERRDEVWAVLGARRPATIEFQGLLEEVADDFWLVGGLRVALSDDSVVEGQPVVGAVVIVHASSPGDGTLLALTLRVQPPPTPPSPTASPLPSPTVTPIPLLPVDISTTTPAPAQTPKATPSAAPPATRSATATGTVEPEPTDRPEPTETEEPEPTHQPGPTKTEEPESTDHPEPTGTEEPEHTRTPRPEPTETEEPEPTETEEPEPTETEGPEPTRTPHPEPSHTEEPEPTDTPGPEPTDDDENANSQPSPDDPWAAAALQVPGKPSRSF